MSSARLIVAPRRDGDVTAKNLRLTCLLPLATLTRWASVGVWLYAGGFAEIVKRWQAGG